MSREGLTSVLGRAAIDPQYLDRLQQNPEAAVAEINADLSPDELMEVKRLDFGALKQFNDQVALRKNLAAFFDGKKDV
jgi:hypothetical protein